MSKLKLAFHPTNLKISPAYLPSSKSLHNRWIVLSQLYAPSLVIFNPSTAHDSRLLVDLFASMQNGQTIFDAQDAGTTFRFLTAVLATQKGTYTITGTDRMKHRPVAGLTKMLTQLGANLQYLEKEGFPPLSIEGNASLHNTTIEAVAHESSQFLSAIAMIAPRFKGGLQIRIPGSIASRSYFNMTLSCLQKLGLKLAWSDDKTLLSIPEFTDKIKQIAPHTVTIETDWSSASYWVLLPLLLPEHTVYLNNLTLDSEQPDALFFKKYHEDLGLAIKEEQGGISVQRAKPILKDLCLDFSMAPDCSLNTIAILSACKVKATIKGLFTLRFKETDRINALQNELLKVGSILEAISEDTFQLSHYSNQWQEGKTPVIFQTYLDHRMAMACSYFACIAPIYIEEPEHVKKSYPDFWRDAALLFETSET